MEAAKVARGRADLDFDHTPWSSDRSLAAESLRSGLSETGDWVLPFRCRANRANRH
jgi:hypothetical protein